MSLLTSERSPPVSEKPPLGYNSKHQYAYIQHKWYLHGVSVYKRDYSQQCKEQEYGDRLKAHTKLPHHQHSEHSAKYLYE